MPLSVSTRGSRRTSGLVTTLLGAGLALVTVASGVVMSTPAQAANRVTPGNFTGYGFDQCVTPSQEAMDAWLTASPYWAVGVYIAGGNRYCGDDKQVHLTPEWVSTQLRNRWRILPITVGPQAPCYANPQKKIRIANNPADDYAAAREQGRREAVDTVQRAETLGIVPRSTLWYDLEAYDTSNERCRDSSLAFLSGWTEQLHDLRYRSGVYASAARGMNALDEARVREPGRFTMPDRIWVADWIDRSRYRKPPRTTPPSLFSSYFGDDGWTPGNRMRQYQGDHDETYGGVTINIDTNYLDLGSGTRPGRAPRFCGGRNVDFPRYRFLRAGHRGGQVGAAQCLLRRKGVYEGRITGRFNRRTTKAVRLFQEGRELRGNGRLLRSTWTVLLSEARRRPVLKIGSGGSAVRRVQRSLNAAIHAGLTVDGVFGPATTAAVREYQREVGLRRTGVVADTTWERLLGGRI